MRLGLDTNRYADHIAGVREVVETLRDADEIVLPFVVLAELHEGFRGGSRRAANEAVLNAFLRKPGIRVIYADAETVDLWATLNADLRRRGRVLPQNDVWIAAICVQHGLRLYTRDKHFDEIPQMVRA